MTQRTYVHRLVVVTVVVTGSASSAQADIFQWEYFNPADPSQGKRQSTTLAPDGAGVNAGPDANLSHRNLTMAYLICTDLIGARGDYANLTNADLSQANLTNANLHAATLTGAGFTGAEVRGASLGIDLPFRCDGVTCGFRQVGTGITLAQLYATASYQAHDLSETSFRLNELIGANFSDQNLTGADFAAANLTGANFRQANLTQSKFAYIKSYSSPASSGFDDGFPEFVAATLTDADFTGAEVRGADFSKGIYSSDEGTGITLAQLYSTASFQAKDLSAIGLWGHDLSGGNFAGQNLTNANFGTATLTNANFSEANLTNAYLPVTLTGANFTDAEVRGARVPGFTLAQLYSTASYQAHDLSGTHFTYSNLAGGNFAGQNLTHANFSYATLTEADFRQANLTEVQWYASNLTGANFAGQNLTNAYFYSDTLSNSNFSRADLTGASFDYATLTGANFTGATVQGANFNASAVGFSAAQLYSTASYQAHDLAGIGLSGYLSGWNFAGQNLTNAHFSAAILIDPEFTDAEVRGAQFDKVWVSHYTPGYGQLTFLSGTGISLAQLYSTASYKARDLTGMGLAYNDLTGANFAGQNLTNTGFGGATLTEANFSGAEIQGADFDLFYQSGCDIFSCYAKFGTGITLDQLYSTASYQAHRLSGTSFANNDLRGGDFAGQDFTNANFSEANLADANFTGADVRGALLDPVPADTTTTNLIWADGYIHGVDLAAGGLLVRDYDVDPRYASPPIPITVEQHLTMGPGGMLRMVFEADAWDSTISFAPGIPITLDGTLELTFADVVNLASQLGRTFDIFDWTGVDPTGAFAFASPYAWDLSNLYTTGEVTLTAVPEPGSSTFAAVGAFSLTLYRRRKIS